MSLTRQDGSDAGIEPYLACSEGRPCAGCDVHDFCEDRAEEPEKIAALAAKE